MIGREEVSTFVQIGTLQHPIQLQQCFFLLLQELDLHVQTRLLELALT